MERDLKTEKHDRARLPCLDGLRAISILFVFFSHASSTMPKGTPGWAPALFDRGDLGVFVFFVLSGYLITHLLLKEWRATGGVTLRHFYLRRFLRIFPAFYAFLIILACLSAVGWVVVARSQLLSAGFFLWNYKHLWDHTPGPGNWFLGHFWSLALEEQFYLLWPITLVLLKPRGASKVALVLVLAMPIARVATYFLIPEWRGQLLMMVHTGADALMFGCLLALWSDTPRLQRFMKRFASPVWPAAAAAFAWLISPTVAKGLPGNLGGGYAITLGRFLTGTSIAFVTAWLLRHPCSAAGRLLNSPAVVRIGILSYSMYLWQQLFLTRLNSSFTGSFPLNIACSYLAAELSYRLIEAPFLKLRYSLGLKAPQEACSACNV